MKIDKKIFISALLVLMILGVMSTVSATDSLDDSLAAENTDAVSVDMGDSKYVSPSSTMNATLGAGETIIYVDSSYDGDERGTEDMPYKTISAAASAATGGETIFIKNGEYTAESIANIDKPLTFNGESYGGVIIKDGTASFLNTYNICTNLVFNNLYFKDIACSGANAVITVGGTSESNNVYITNCIFDNCSGRYGAIRIYSKFGEVVVDNCKFINTKETNGKYSTAIYFGSSGTNTYTIKNTIIEGSSNSGSSTSTYGAIYVDRASGGPTILDNVTISDCSFTGANGLISTKGPLNISNSKIINNDVDVGALASGSLIWIQSGNAVPAVNVETTIFLNNTGTNYMVGASGDKVAVNVNYNNIQNNTFSTKVAYSDGYNFDYNYWGSNDEPTGVNVNNWAIEDHGEFKLNDGSELAKQIPKTGDEPVGDENTTFVSVDGDDNNTGSADSPVATIAKAVELAQAKSGEIIINAGTYTENNIIINSTIPISIEGIGTVVIDGNASSNSIFKILGGQVTLTNLRFTNNKPKYGGAIMINYATGGGSRTVIDIDVTVDNCIFENIESSSRGGSIYAAYTKGNLIVKDSQFINSSASSWGGGIAVVYSVAGGGLDLEISDCTFEKCYGNNGGAGYLQAKTINITNCVFDNNTANYDSAAMQIYNSTATIDNCIITNNVGGGKGVAIKETTATGYIPTLTITNSVIENNTGRESTLPAILVDKTTLDVSYSSIVNDLSVETVTATGYSAIYGQGIAILNNNWWGTNDPSTKVTGTNITMDNWVIMNVEANVTEAVPGDKVTLTVDFNHVNTTAGEIEELTGGVIPKTYKVQLSSNDGTIVPSTLTIKDGATKSAVYTVADLYDVVSVSCDEALVEMTFVPEVPPYYGIIYVSKDGDDNNNGSEDYPVATIAKAIELASVVGGSHQIVINEGTYKPDASLTITDDLTITGNGAVVIDADGMEKLIDLPYSSPVKGFTVELNNLALINGNGNQYATVYNYADAYLFLNNVNISDCTGSYLGGIITTTGNTTITDSVISDCTAGRIVYASVGYNKPITVTLINTTLKDNVAFIDDGSDLGAGYALIDMSSTTKNTVLNLIDSHIIGNTGKLGTVYTTSDKVVMNVNGTEFIDNTVLVGSGGAINGYFMAINNSTFINNTAANVQGRDGGAIYIGRLGKAVITNSKFADNSATGKGNTIYNGWELTINNCVILDNTEGNVIYHNGEDNVMDANYNWWGTNDDPSSLIGVGEYEDDSGWGYEPCEFDASKWVVMNVVNNLTSADPLNINDTIEFTVDFRHYTDATGTLKDLEGPLPEVEVSGNAIKGFFDEDTVATENNVATLVYTADIGGEEEINITSTKAVDTTLITIIEPVVVEVVYVSPDGDDNNAGYFDEPVATIAHAIEIAERGKIVIFEGNYTIDATLIIKNDLDIRAYEDGVVVIDGNKTRIIENSANLNLTNIIFTNAKAANSAAILDDGNMTIEGCTFYNNIATSSTGGNIVNNRKGTMTINDSKFYENIASRGALASQAATNLIVNNSEFYNNDMSLTGSSSYYGIIYSTSADTVVENTVFRGNKAKQGAGIWASKSTSATTGSLEVINCTFENNVAYVGTGGAIFTSGSVTANVRNSTFINNTATKSDSGVGGNGGAIYTTGTASVKVTNSIFIDNSGAEDAGIYVGATGSSASSLDISNSVILTKDGDANYALNAASGAKVTADGNFWGDNSKANTNAAADYWVIMTGSYDNETGVISIAFDKVNSTDGEISDYGDILPDGFNVSVTTSSGKLDEILPVIGGQASTTFTTKESDNIIITCRDAEVIIPIIVEPKIIYVAVDGDDNNDGSKDSPVATIAHAIEIAEEGKIIIMEGTYTTPDLGIISNDLNITGNGTVIIDAQKANRILYVGEDASVVLKNLIMINGAASNDDSGALIGNANELTLINCTLANSSAGLLNGGAIYNAGKLTIINSTIANNTARMGGAIFTQDPLSKGTELTIINSTFENNIASGNDNSGGGAIFAQQLGALSIDNTSFIGNEALDTSSGGAIFISHSDAEFTIDNSKFIANHANGKDTTGGGAIYMAGTSNYQRSGKLSITNTLFEENTADACGAAIYARATTVDVTNSVIFANKDPSGFAVYGYKTDQVSPAITLNDNWWGTNDDPKDYVGGNNNYKPTLSRWVILTATNDTPFVEGNTVKITANLNTWTDGEENGTLATPITIPRDVVIETTFESIEGVMENGEFTTDYVVPAGLKLVAVNVDIQNIELLRIKEQTVLTIENITAVKGDKVNITATVKDKEGLSVFVGDVEVYFDSELVATIPVIGGSAIQEVTIDKDAGVYDIFAVYIDSTGDFETSNATAVLNVTKKDANLNIANISVDELNNVEITVEIDDGVEGNVTFIVSGDNVYYTEDVVIEDGTAICEVPEALPKGEYTILAVFEGNDYYNFSNDTRTLDVSAIPTVIVENITVIDINNNYVVATLKDINDRPIDQAEVTLEIDGNTYSNITDANGQVQFDCGDLDSGNYKATISYDGNAIYAPVTEVIDITVKTNITISAVYDEDNQEIIATLINDATGKPKTSANVQIDINGKTIRDKSDSNGQVIVSTATLTPGNYTAVISYKGNDKYNPAEASITFISKANIVISAVYDEDNQEIIATLVNEATGKAKTSANVYVTIDGKTTRFKSDSNGQVIISTANLAPGDYSAFISYKGNDKYNPANTTLDFVVKADVDIAAVYDADGMNVVATLINNATGAPVVGADVLVTIDGVTTSVESDSNGQVTVSTAGLDPGNYAATISYEGDDKYNPANISLDFTIKTNITISAVYDADNREIIATLINDATGKPKTSANVQVTIDGKTIKVKSDSNGQVKVSTADLTSGNYTAVISYGGNDKYNPANTSIDFNVKTNIIISAVYDADNQEIIATLINEVTGKAKTSANVYVTIDDKTTRFKSDSNGQVIISTAKLAPGDYSAFISYRGNDKYNPANTTLDFVKAEGVLSQTMSDLTGQNVAIAVKS